MTDSFVQRKSRDFFRNKKAKVLSTQSNLGGEEIKKDEVVTIISKNRDINTCLDIRSDSGTTIYRVSADYLELIK